MGRHRCLSCFFGAFCTKHKYIKLVHRDCLKPSMWINKHIENYYRPTELPWNLCVFSIFDWNNETLNIWSHLFGFIYLSYLQYKTIFDIFPKLNAPLFDYVVMNSAMFCCQICMLLSSAYHTFGCHSVTRRKFWLRLDLSGVSFALLGLYLSGIYTSFYQFPEIQKFYTKIFVSICSVVGIYTTFRRLSLNDTRERQSKFKRIGLLQFIYISLAFAALYPTWHWIKLHGGLTNPHVQKWLPNLFIFFLIIGIAFAFYVTCVPECWFPGRFDLIGCSHQFWHVFIFIAMAYWHTSGVELLTFYHTSGNPNQFIQQMNSNISLNTANSSSIFT